MVRPIEKWLLAEAEAEGEPPMGLKPTDPTAATNAATARRYLLPAKKILIV
jgi:hypothetical protein